MRRSLLSETRLIEKRTMHVLFKRGSAWSPLDIATRFLTSGPFAHCELLFEDGNTFTAYMGPGTGFYRFAGSSFYSRGEDGTDEWSAFEVQISHKDEQIIRAFCAKRLSDLPYNYFGMACLPFLKVGHVRRSAFCSEACTLALQRVGLLCRVSANRISPNELFRQLDQWGCLRHANMDSLRSRYTRRAAQL